MYATLVVKTVNVLFVKVVHLGTQLQNESFLLFSAKKVLFYSLFWYKMFSRHEVTIEYIILADSDLADLLIGNLKSCLRMC